MNRNKAETDETYVSFDALTMFGLEYLLHLSRKLSLTKERSRALRRLLFHTIENNVEKFIKQPDDPYSGGEMEPEDVVSPPSSEDEYDSDVDDFDEEDFAMETPTPPPEVGPIPAASDSLDMAALSEKYSGARFSLHRLRKALKDAFPQFEFSKFENETNRFRSYQTAIQGKRNYMEDQVCVLQNPADYLANEELENVSYYGVYDGHGGACAAKYILRRLHNRIFANEKFPKAKGEGVVQGISEALTKEIIQIDTEFNDMSDSKGWKSGSTAIVSIVHGDHLVSACVGDSRSVLYRGGKSVVMNEAHSPCNEKERIEKIGGVVLFYMGAWRVNGVIGVSRSIGDPSFRQLLIPDPDIKDYSVVGADYMIMATDGLWDVVKEEEIPVLFHNARVRGLKKAKLVAKMKVKSEGGDPNTADLQYEEDVDLSKVLVKEALKRGSRDNISVVVVLFSPLPNITTSSPPPEPAKAEASPEPSESSESSEKPSEPAPAE